MCRFLTKGQTGQVHIRFCTCRCESATK